MQLVDDDKAQVLEQLGPPGMVREDARVQHVGIAQHHVRTRANRPPRVLRRVAVIGEHADRVGALTGHQGRHLVQLRKLILRQGLRRKQIQAARGRIFQDAVEHGGVVAERFARGGGRDDHDVAAGQGVVDGIGLMGVQPVDAPRRKRLNQPRVERPGERRVRRVERRQLPHCRDVRIDRRDGAGGRARAGGGPRQRLRRPRGRKRHRPLGHLVLG